MEWKYIENETPRCYETGDWDGKRSNEIVVEDDIHMKHIVRVYDGILDGSKFINYINNDYVVDREIIRWLELPE